MVLLRQIKIAVFIGALLFTAASAHAWDYDSGWLDTASNGTTTQCHYDSRPGARVPCSLVQGQSNMYFITDIKLPRFTLSEGQCQVQVRAAYSGNRQRREDFLFGVNGQAIRVYDQDDRGSNDEVLIVTLPTTFTFYSEWNRVFFMKPRIANNGNSVWFGDFHSVNGRIDPFHETDADGQLVAGRRAIRIQCNSGSGTAQAVCGNDIIETGEECDDGNTRDNDGCSSTCKNESSIQDCPFTATSPNDIIVDFGGVHTNEHNDVNKGILLTSRRNSPVNRMDRASHEYTISNVNVPKGIYDIYLAEYDDSGSWYLERNRGRSALPPNEWQKREQYYIVGKNSSNEDLFQSGATQDLRDDIDNAEWHGKVSTSQAVADDIKSILIKHAAYPDDTTANGVFATCALFKKQQAVCGNGTVETGEECDDGNGDNTDGCTAYCKVAQCGDGYIHDGVEQCDDGNTVDGDGCSATCRVELSIGTCGAAQDVVSCSAPIVNLCATGVATHPLYDRQNRKWKWSCGSSQCFARKRCGFDEVAP